MRSLVVCLCLLAASAANATAVTFDFEELPDSAGCDVPVSSYGRPRPIPPSCEFLWVVANNASGYGMPMVDTEQGLTMEIVNNEYNMSIWWNGTFMCGNAPWCNPYLASFSKPLSAITVDFAGIGSGDAMIDAAGFFSYSISAYSGAAGTGVLLGTTTVGRIPLPSHNLGYYSFPLSLTLSDLGDFRSVWITAMALSEGELRNNARIEAIHAVPEPPTMWMLAAAGLFGFLWARRANQ